MNHPWQAARINRRTGLFAGLGVLLSGCSATGALNALVARDSNRGQDGIAYGPDLRQKLDVFKPVGEVTAAPIVVFFYGGNWTRGSRTDYRFVGDALAAHGVIAVVADYRLSPQVRWQQILTDCAAAVKWSFDNAFALGGDPRKVYLMGHSAGAYNAAMLALDARWLRAVGLRPQQLAGFIGLAGPYDFLPIDNAKAQVAFNWPDTPADSQPLFHASAAAPRTLLLVAEGDRTVRPERNSAQLAQKLRAAGVEVTFKRYDAFGANHVTLVGALAGPLRWLAPVREDVLAFLQLPGSS